MFECFEFMMQCKIPGSTFSVPEVPQDVGAQRRHCAKGVAELAH